MARYKPIVRPGGTMSGGGYDEDGNFVKQEDLNRQDFNDSVGNVNKAGSDAVAALPPNASQQDIARAKEQAEQGAMGPNGLTNNGKRADNPGSADVGGASGMGEEYRQAALAHMHEGDAAYNANGAALNGSIANMTQDRGEMSPENSALLGREAGTRGQQLGSLDLDRNAAMGNAPSAAGFQTNLDMNSVMAGSAGAMGGARGLGALNGGQVLGASTGASAAGGAALNGGMGRSQEMGTALGMYGSNAGNVRQGDLARLSEGSKNSMFNADLNNDWKTSNAALAAKQGQLGVEQDKMRGSWYDASTTPAQHQAQMDQTMRGMQHGQNAADASAAVARSRDNQDRDRRIGGNAAQVGLTALGSMAGPGGTAVGGMMGSEVNNGIQNHKYG